MTELSAKRVITWLAVGGELIASFQGKNDRRRNVVEFKVYPASADATSDETYARDVAAFLSMGAFPVGTK